MNSLNFAIADKKKKKPVSKTFVSRDCYVLVCVKEDEIKADNVADTGSADRALKFVEEDEMVATVERKAFKEYKVCIFFNFPVTPRFYLYTILIFWRKLSPRRPTNKTPLPKRTNSFTSFRRLVASTSASSNSFRPTCSDGGCKNGRTWLRKLKIRRVWGSLETSSRNRRLTWSPFFVLMGALARTSLRMSSACPKVWWVQNNLSS